MAIVQTGKARNGVRYRIDDSCAARPGTAEYARTVAEQCRIAHGILVRAAMRKQGGEHGRTRCKEADPQA